MRNVLTAKDRGLDHYRIKKDEPEGTLNQVYGPGIVSFKLSLVLLIYIYSKDQVISSEERESFNEVIDSIDVLSETEKQEIRELLNTLPNLDYVVRYVSENNITYKQVLSAIDFLNNEVKIDKKDSASLIVVKYKCEKLIK
jgi:hypothetical protein